MNNARNKFHLGIYKETAKAMLNVSVERGNNQKNSLSYTDEFNNTNEFELIEITDG